MVKLVIRAESIASVPSNFTTTLYQQDISEGQFKREDLNISRLALGSTAEASHRIWYSTEWDKKYGLLQLDWIEVKTGKYVIMFMGGDVHGDWEIDFFHSM